MERGKRKNKCEVCCSVSKRVRSSLKMDSGKLFGVCVWFIVGTTLMAFMLSCILSPFYVYFEIGSQ